jgi:hypothetical protein
MSHNWNKMAQLSVIAAAYSLAVWIGSTNAKESSVLVDKAATTNTLTGPVLPPPANPNSTAADASPASEPVVPPLNVSPVPESLPTPPQSKSTTTVRRPFLRPAEPRGSAKGKLVVGEESIPMPQGAAPAVQAPVVEGPPIDVKPTPPIEYDTDGDARKMYRTGKIDLIMLTKNPADGCAYEIPICIPACCIGDPTVSGGRGILGRGIVEYRWACGFRAIVKFRHIRGDVEVEYEGD